MSDDLLRVIADRVRTTHAQLLAVTGALDEAALAWSPGSHAPPVRFHLWHVARYADRIQALLPGITPELQLRLGPGEEIWEHEGIAAAWGLTAADLGPVGTGFGMDHDASVSLPLPPRDSLLDYAGRAFAAADRAIAAVDAEQARARGVDVAGNALDIGTMIVNHLGHAGRHLGMIEGLIGVQGQAGTATV